VAWTANSSSAPTTCLSPKARTQWEQQTKKALPKQGFEGKTFYQACFLRWAKPSPAKPRATIASVPGSGTWATMFVVPNACPPLRAVNVKV